MNNIPAFNWSILRSNRKFLTTKTEFINFLVNDDTVVKIVGRPVLTLIVEVVGSHLI